MFKFFSKFAAFYLVSRWLMPRWRMLSVTIFGVLLINYLHAEYLDYVAVSENTEYLASSYVGKFTLIIGVIFGCSLRLRANSSAKEETEVVADEQGIKPEHRNDDGFDFLREKKELDSQSSKILKNK